MRRTTLNKNQWWMTLSAAIVGFDEQGGGAPVTQGGAEGGQGSGPTGAEGQGEGNPPAPKTYTAEELAGLKSALEKERNDRKALDKELSSFRKAQQEREDAEKTEVQRLTDQQNRLAQNYAKLAEGYRDNAVEKAVLAEATKLKFLDPSDALRNEVLRGLTVEQNEEDPTQVTVDMAEIQRRVKELARSKPHYVTQGPARPPVAQKSGSQFNSQQPRGTDQQSAERARLAELYPALKGI